MEAQEKVERKKVLELTRVVLYHIINDYDKIIQYHLTMMSLIKYPLEFDEVVERLLRYLRRIEDELKKLEA